jgi:hypothetical protein
MLIFTVECPLLNILCLDYTAPATAATAAAKLWNVPVESHKLATLASSAR